MKKAILIFVVIMIIMSLNVFAASDFTTEGNGVITGYNGVDTDIAIPSDIDGENITAIGKYAFMNKCGIRSITIPDTVTSIGEWSFCSVGISSIIIPNSVTTIQNSAFRNSGSLGSVIILNDSVSFGSDVFIGTHAIVIKGNKGSTAESYATSNGHTFRAIYENVGSVLIGYNGFGGDVTIPSVIDGEIITTIGAEAFKNNTTITSITIPDSITNIDSNAFYGCSNLTSVTFSGTPTITTIGQSAFFNSGLIGITIPDSVTSIGDTAFGNCSSLTNVAFDGTAKITSIGNSVFLNSGLTNIDIPSSVEQIGSSAFESTSLTIIDIPVSVTEIGLNAFKNTDLTEITIPESVTTLGWGVFEDCIELKKATILNKKSDGESGALDFGGNDLFSNTHVDFKIIGYPSSGAESYAMTNSIPFEAILDFNTSDNGDGTVTITGYNGILPTNLAIPDSIEGKPVTAIDNNAFQHNTDITSVTIPDSILSIGESAFNDCSNLTTVTFSGTPTITIINDHTFDNCSSLSDITIPNTVTKIGNHAFANCLSLSNIIISTAVTSIGENAFDNTGLTSITIPDSVISIGEWAFNDCSNLTTVTFSGTPTITIINDHTFANCSSLFDITIPDKVTNIDNYAFTNCSNLSNIVLPTTLVSIGENVFSNSGITSITIPSCITNIGNNTFANCSNLTKATIFNKKVSGQAGALTFGTDVFNNTHITFKIKGYAGSTAQTYANNNGHIFEAITISYTITASAGSGGSISSSGVMSVQENSSKTFSISPNSGFQIDNVLVDGCSIGKVTSYKFDNIIADHTIVAIFKVLTSCGGTGGNRNTSSDGSKTDVTNKPIAPTSNDDTNIDISKNSQISTEFFDLVDKGKDVTFETDNYTLTFEVNSDVKNTDAGFIDLGISKTSQNEDRIKELTGKDTVNISFNHKNDFPSKGKLTIDSYEYPDGDVYVYKYNEQTNKVEIAGLLKSENGEVTFEVESGGDYIISDSLLITKDVYKEDINKIGYVKGYPDNKFGADDNITRAQTATMLSNILKESGLTHEGVFNDIGMWAKEDILNMEGLGYISGYSDDTFKPHNNITRAEFVKIIVNVFGVEDVQSYKEVDLIDISNRWARNEIEICYRLGIVSGYNKEFRPNDNITRAEAVTIINKLINRDTDTQGKENPFDDLSEEHWAYNEILSVVGE